MQNTGKQIARAFSRTQPHPADSRVRLTDDPEDLCAVMHPEASAVILRRKMPKDVRDTLRRVQDWWRGQKGGTAERAALENAALEKMYYSAACAREKERLVWAFHKATGFEARGNFQTGGALLAPGTRARPEAVFTPHVDTNFFLRGVLVHTLDETLGTEWYPADKAAEISGLRTSFNQTALSALQKKKERYGMQHVRPGDILILKGDLSPHAATLLHSSPCPKRGVLRMVHLYGA